MIENPASVEQARPRANVNDILVSPIRIDGKKVGTHYDLIPDPNWKDINKFDSATQVKKTDGSSVALSDHLLDNVKTIAQLAFEKKFITPEDISIKIPIKDDQGNDTGNESAPLSFLNIKGERIIFPKNLTAQQTQELMFLVYKNTVNNQDRDPNSNTQPDVLIEAIQKATSGFQETGKVDKSAKLILDNQSPQTTLRALNISLRKSVENAIKERTYSTTKVPERKKDAATEKLLKRLEVGAEVNDLVEGETIERSVEGKMAAFKDSDVQRPEDFGKRTARELDQTVQYDLLMAQAFDVLVPPKARLEMEQAEISISKELNYMERAKMRADLAKTRQVWRMAALDYLNATSKIPGTEISTYAQDLKNNKIFSPGERKLIHQHSEEIGQRKAELDTRQDGFNNLNVESSNQLKAEELLLLLKPAGKTQIPDGLSKILEQSTSLNDEKQIIKAIKETGILNGLDDKKSELANKIIRDALSTKISIDKRLNRLSKNGGVDVPVESLDFASSVDNAVKGIDLLYRRGLSQSIDEADRYNGHDIVRDANEKPHLIRKLRKGEKRSKQNGFGENLPAGGASSRGEAKMNQTNAESKVTPAPRPKEPPTGSENPSAAQEAIKKQNENAVKLAKLLNLKDSVTNATEFRDALMGDENLVTEVSGHYEVNINQLDLISADQLATLSHLSELINIPIQIDSLNLQLNAGEQANTTLNNFNIRDLFLTGEQTEAHALTLQGSNAENIMITKGNFVVMLDKDVPKRIDMNNNNLDKTLNLVVSSWDTLNQTISHFDAKDLKTKFNLDSGAKVEVVLHEPPKADEVKYSDIDENDAWSKGEKKDGDNFLVVEGGKFKLKPKPESEEVAQVESSAPVEEKPAEPPKPAETPPTEPLAEPPAFGSVNDFAVGTRVQVGSEVGVVRSLAGKRMIEVGSNMITPEAGARFRLVEEVPQPAPVVESLGATAQEQDDAVAWLESLAAKHGAKAEDLAEEPDGAELKIPSITKILTDIPSPNPEPKKELTGFEKTIQTAREETAAAGKKVIEVKTPVEEGVFKVSNEVAEEPTINSDDLDIPEFLRPDKPTSPPVPRDTSSVSNVQDDEGDIPTFLKNRPRPSSPTQTPTTAQTPPPTEAPVTIPVQPEPQPESAPQTITPPPAETPTPIKSEKKHSFFSKEYWKGFFGDKKEKAEEPVPVEDETLRERAANALDPKGWRASKEDNIPDWLKTLGEVPQTSDEADEVLAVDEQQRDKSEEAPDWLKSLNTKQESVEAVQNAEMPDHVEQLNVRAEETANAISVPTATDAPTAADIFWDDAPTAQGEVGAAVESAAKKLLEQLDPGQKPETEVKDEFFKLIQAAEKKIIFKLPDPSGLISQLNSSLNGFIINRRFPTSYKRELVDNAFNQKLIETFVAAKEFFPEGTSINDFLNGLYTELGIELSPLTQDEINKAKTQDNSLKRDVLWKSASLRHSGGAS